MTTKYWPIAIAILSCLWIWSARASTPSVPPPGWVGIDTRFAGANGYVAADYDQQQRTIELVLSAARNGAKVVVLPESALGTWTPTAQRLWASALKELDITVVAGATVVHTDGYDNVLVSLSALRSEVVYRQRMPVPVSMWQPWRTDESSAAAHWFEAPTIAIGGIPVLPLICYEQLLIWPVLQSAAYAPRLLVATGNAWWTHGTSIAGVQHAAAEAWAKLFNLPLVTAFNY